MSSMKNNAMIGESGNDLSCKWKERHRCGHGTMALVECDRSDEVESCSLLCIDN